MDAPQDHDRQLLAAGGVPAALIRNKEWILEEFVRYYNEDRTHQALGAESPVLDDERGETGRLVSVPYLGGLHHGYRRAA